MNGSLDTNVVLRWLVEDIPAQQDAARELVKGGEYLVSDAAVIEATFALGRYYRFTRQEQLAVMLGFLSQPTLVCNFLLLSEAFDLYVDHPKLSFEDCYMVTAAEHAEAAPLFTFDQKLASQTSAQLVG